MDSELSNQLFQKFSDLVYQESGINLHDGKKALLQVRLNKRLRATQLPSYESYYKYITSANDGEELIQFLNCISTNLTFFFRERQHFQFLQRVLPELIAAKKQSRSNRLRIWSAGCSTGEEPYSLAMLVLPFLDDYPACDFRILATDISTQVLQVAAQGIYPANKVAQIPETLRMRFVQKASAPGSVGTYEMAPVLKRVVTFRRVNLKDTYPFKGPFDLIFCRNVMIYFDKSTQERLVQKMAHYLPQGGYLFVGHSESLMGLAHPLSYVCPAVYRK